MGERNTLRTDAGEPPVEPANLKKVGKMKTIEIVGKQGQGIHLANETSSPLASVYQSKGERSASDGTQLPLIQSQLQLGVRRLQDVSPSRALYLQSLQGLEIVGSKKSAIPLIRRERQAKVAGKKSRKYFHETIPAQNEDIRSYANLGLSESRQTTALMRQHPE